MRICLFAEKHELLVHIKLVLLLPTLMADSLIMASTLQHSRVSPYKLVNSSVSPDLFATSLDLCRVPIHLPMEHFALVLRTGLQFGRRHSTKKTGRTGEAPNIQPPSTLLPHKGSERLAGLGAATHTQ